MISKPDAHTCTAPYGSWERDTRGTLVGTVGLVKLRFWPQRQPRLNQFDIMEVQVSVYPLGISGFLQCALGDHPFDGLVPICDIKTIWHIVGRRVLVYEMPIPLIIYALFPHPQQNYALDFHARLSASGHCVHVTVFKIPAT